MQEGLKVGKVELGQMVRCCCHRGMGYPIWTIIIKHLLTLVILNMNVVRVYEFKAEGTSLIPSLTVLLVCIQ